MKKVVYIIFAFFAFLTFLSVNAFSLNGPSELLQNADSETKAYLEELGIDTENGNGAENVSLKTVFEFLIRFFTNKAEHITVFIISIIAVIIINAVLLSFLEDNASACAVINYISVLCIVTVVIVPLKDMILNAGAVIKTAAIFTDAYIPILAGIVAASGNPKLAITYNSFAITLSSFIAETADTFFKPIVNALFAFNILTSFTFDSYKHKIAQSVKRLVIVVLSLISTVYTGLLTTQSILAVSQDSLTVRGIRFFSGTFIPIVGGGVSESVSSIISSLSVMRNTSGVIVIVIIMLIFIPIIIELLIWYFALQFCSIASDLFGNQDISELLSELSSIVSLINIILFYITFVLVISTGVIIVSGK